MSLEAFSLKDLQTYKALSQALEGEGINDSRFVRQLLDNEINRRAKMVGRISRIVHKPKKTEEMQRVERLMKLVEICPQCGRQMYTSMIDQDTLQFVCTNRKKDASHIGCHFAFLKTVSGGM